MPKKIIHRGALRTAILKVLIYGILVEIILEIIALLLLMNVQWDFVYWSYRIFHWPTGLLSGMIVSAIVVFLSRTTVEVEEGRILVRNIGRRKCFGLSQFVDSSIVRKMHIGAYSKYIT